MRYEIRGESMPVVICQVDPDETMICESGAMSWMTPNMEMQTSGGGMGKMLGRMFSGESAFQNRYTARKSAGTIAFASKFPGSLKAFEITPSAPIICQKRASLASTEGVELSVYLHEKAGAGFFGGEGFIMQKISGSGTVFLEIDGSTVEYTLQAGQQLLVDTGYVAMMDATVRMEIQRIKGVKNALLGGEGFFNTLLTGPGRVLLQTMPLSGFASTIAAMLPSKG